MNTMNSDFLNQFYENVSLLFPVCCFTWIADMPGTITANYLQQSSPAGWKNLYPYYWYGAGQAGLYVVCIQKRAVPVRRL